MKLLLAFFLLAVTVLPSQARLFETLKELKRRYGTPIDAEATSASGGDRYSFRWDRYVVTVTLRDGNSVSEEFARPDRKEFSLSEVQLLLMESSDPGLAWTQVDGNTWNQQDRVATWSKRSLLVEEKARTRRRR